MGDVDLHTLPPREAVEAFRRRKLEEARQAPWLFSDRANADGYTQLAYAGRFAFELLQNACDAHDRLAALHAAGRAKAPSTPRATVVLTDDWLFAANTGHPFSFEPLDEGGESGIASICRHGASGKVQTAGGLALKGQFGLGFKSVDEIASEVLIVSGDFRLRFDRSALKSALGSDAPLRLPLLYAPEWFEDGPPILDELRKEHDTVVALRLAQDDLEDVRARLSEIGPDEMLLLETLRELRIEDRSRGGALGLDLRLKHLDAGTPELWEVSSNAGVPLQRYALFRRSIDGGAQDHRVAWRLDANNRIQPVEEGLFMTFYPISGEPCDVPFLVHSYFKLDSNRKAFAEGATDLATNRKYMEAILQLVQDSLPHVDRLDRGGLALHELIWPGEVAVRRGSAAQWFHEQLREQAWTWPIFEGFDGTLRKGDECVWPPAGLGLDDVVGSTGPALVPQRPDGVHPRPDDCAPLTHEHLAVWFRDTTPSMPDPGAFARLLRLLDGFITDQEDRVAFQKAVQGAPILPVLVDGDVQWVGQSEAVQIFQQPEGRRPIDLPSTLDPVFQVRVLHPDAAAPGGRGGPDSVRALFGVTALGPDDLMRGLERALVDRSLGVDEARAVLRTVVVVLQRRLMLLLTEPGLPKPWFHEDPGSDSWRTRIRLMGFPIPLKDGPPVSAGELCLEQRPGDLSRFYPPDGGQRFLNEHTEDPAARDMIDELVPDGDAGGWDFRRRVYAYLGVWPMPRLDAYFAGDNRLPGGNCPHPGMPGQDWKDYLDWGRGSGNTLRNAQVLQSLYWPNLDAIAQHCVAHGLLPALLEEVQRHRKTLASEAVSRFQAGARSRYARCAVLWQLRNVRWLPSLFEGRADHPICADEAWWTADRLRTDPARLRGSQWIHLPTLHAGTCERWLAELLGLCDHDRPGSPDEATSRRRSVRDLGRLVRRAETHDGDGLRKRYCALTTRLGQLGGDLQVPEILVRTGSGPARAVAPGDAWIDDLPLPLPLGRDQLSLALLGPHGPKLALQLGARSLRSAFVRYHASDLDDESLEERELTAALQSLVPVAFALRAYRRRPPQSNALDLSRDDKLIERAAQAVVELVEGVSIFVLPEEPECWDATGHKPLAIQDERHPVVVRHDVVWHDTDSRYRLPVFFRRAVVRAHRDTTELLPLLAPVAAQLAGDEDIADTLELLVREHPDLAQASLESYLEQRCGVRPTELVDVQRLCGLDVDRGGGQAPEAQRQYAWDQWRVRCSVLCRPLLARLACLGEEAGVATVRARLEGLRDHPDPLGAARRAFAPQGVPLDDPLWSLSTPGGVDAFLQQNPELMLALERTLSAADRRKTDREALEAEVADARGYALTFARQHVPTRRLLDLLDDWEELAEHPDVDSNDTVGALFASFLERIGVEGHARTVALEAPGIRWAPDHLTAMGLSESDVLNTLNELARLDHDASRTQAKRERQYANWIRARDHHKTVVPTRIELEDRTPPPPSGRDGAPVMELKLEDRGGPGRHLRKHRRNTITGGLGEVFVAMQEVERWRTLSQTHLESLLDEVGALFGGDATAQNHRTSVLHGDSSTDDWEKALLSLLRIGDLARSRCDLLGFREHEDRPYLVFLEIKATRDRSMDSFPISAAEWEFLSDPEVRDRCAIVCVTGAERGRVPKVEVLANPALLPMTRVRVSPTTFELTLNRRGSAD